MDKQPFESSSDQRVPAMEDLDSFGTSFNISSDTSYQCSSFNSPPRNTCPAASQLVKLQEMETQLQRTVIERAIETSADDTRPPEVDLRRCRSEPELTSLSSSPPPPIRPRTSSAAQTIPFRPRRMRVAPLSESRDVTNETRSTAPVSSPSERRDVTSQSRVRFELSAMQPGQ